MVEGIGSISRLSAQLRPGESQQKFERDAARAGFTLETSIPDGLPALTGDREALTTALRNLLDNAVKYSPGGRTIWLDACAGDGLDRWTAPRASSTLVVEPQVAAVQRSSGARSAPKQTAVRVRVRDEGVGIAARHQPHIFEKFYRVDGDLAQTVKGVGPGLSLVQHIVRAHNGRVLVESQEGQGSTCPVAC